MTIEIDGFVDSGFENQLEWLEQLVGLPSNTENKEDVERAAEFVDNKMEDLIVKGARIYYKDMAHCARIDRSGASTIGHSDHDKPEFFSRRYPNVTPDKLVYGTW